MEYTLSDESPRVLVVDDEAVIREIISDFLSMEGYVVKTVGNGEEAIKELETNIFDIVITDLKMPRVDGLQLLDHIKNMDREMVAIMMTGFGTVETAIKAMKKGAYDYILKPFKMDDVLLVLKRGLEQHRLKLENIQLKETLSLYKLSEAISANLPFDDMLEIILDSTMQVASADAVQLLLTDQHNNSFKESKRKISPGILGGDATDLGEPDMDRLMALFDEDSPVIYHGHRAQVMFLQLPCAVTFESYMAFPLRAGGRIIGILQVFSFSKGKKFNEGKRKLLTILAGRAAAAIENAMLYTDLQDTFKQTIQSFAHALEAKDPYTHGHSDRVAEYSEAVAKGLQFSLKETEIIRQAAVLHDIGKLGMRFEELNKPQKLTAEEYQMFKQHPTMGRRILEPIAFLSDIVPLVYHHHEKFDGSGYPEGLAGQDIPLGARILAVADTYDAMTTDRPYRKALPHKVAISELKRFAGTQFDPMVVGIFLIVIEKYRKECIEQGKSVPK
ncbi:MAG: response regulator [Deltaproteobacteria bacterium]|nr:response regulator [Deltaproteobacteria bacterium]